MKTNKYGDPCNTFINLTTEEMCLHPRNFKSSGNVMSLYAIEIKIVPFV